MLLLTVHVEHEGLVCGLVVEVVVGAAAVRRRAAVPGHVAQRECQGDGVPVQPSRGHVHGDSAVLGVEPLQLRVQVARGPAGQRDVLALDGGLGLDEHVVGAIYGHAWRS